MVSLILFSFFTLAASSYWCFLRAGAAAAFLFFSAANLSFFMVSPGDLPAPQELIFSLKQNFTALVLQYHPNLSDFLSQAS